MVATGRIVAASQVDLSYSPRCANIHGLLGPHESSHKRHLNWLNRFCRAHIRDQHKDTEATERQDKHRKRPHLRTAWWRCGLEIIAIKLHCHRSVALQVKNCLTTYMTPTELFPVSCRQICAAYSTVGLWSIFHTAAVIRSRRSRVSASPGASLKTTNRIMYTSWSCYKPCRNAVFCRVGSGGVIWKRETGKRGTWKHENGLVVERHDQA